MPEPVYSASTERVYASLPEHYRTADERLDYPLKRYLSAIVDRAGEVEVLLDRLDLDSAAGDTSSALVDPDTADDRWLDWLGQLLGVRLPAGLSPMERRDAVRFASAGWRAGTRQAVADAGKSELTGTRYAEVRDHTTDTSARGAAGEWDVLVITRTSETPSAAAVVDAIYRKGAAPAGVKLWHRAYEATWDQIEARFGTGTGAVWDNLDGRTWTDIEESGLA